MKIKRSNIEKHNSPRKPAKESNLFRKKHSSVEDTGASYLRSKRKKTPTASETKITQLRETIHRQGVHVQGNFLAYLAILIYFFVTVTSTTHEDLLRETPVAVPLLNITLPLWWFFLAGPFALMLIHFNLLRQYYYLSKNLHYLDTELCIQYKDEEKNNICYERDQHSSALLTTIFLDRDMPGVLRILSNVALWGSSVLAPLVVLYLFQWYFLAYHSSFVTWAQRVFLYFDALVMLAIWKEIFKMNYQVTHKKRLKKLSRIMTTILVFVFVSTVPLIIATETDLSQKAKEFIQTEDRTFEDVNFEDVTIEDVTIEDITIEDITIEDVNFEDVNFEDVTFEDVTFEDVTFEDVTFEDVAFGDVAFGDVAFGDVAFGDVTTSKLLKIICQFFLKVPLNLNLPNHFFVKKDIPVDIFIEPNLEFKEYNRRLANYVKNRQIGINLRNRDLKNVNFNGSKFLFASFQNTCLSGANMFKADLKGANMFKADLKDADMKGADLKGANMFKADLKGAKMTRANLKDADMTGADLEGAKMFKADLKGTKMFKADLKGTKMFKADLKGADMWMVDLKGADMWMADLKGANMTGADLKGANMTGADLKGANMTGADLEGAHMEAADLKGADMTEADLKGADMTGADLKGTLLPSRMLNVDLRGASFGPLSPKEWDMLIQTVFEEADTPSGLSESLKYQNWMGQSPDTSIVLEDCLFDETTVHLFGLQGNSLSVLEFTPKYLQAMIDEICNNNAIPTIYNTAAFWVARESSQTQLVGYRYLSQASCPDGKEPFSKEMQKEIQDKLATLEKKYPSSSGNKGN